MSGMWRILPGMGLYRRKWKKPVMIRPSSEKDTTSALLFSEQPNKTDCLPLFSNRSQNKASIILSPHFPQAAKAESSIVKKCKRREVKPHDRSNTTEKPDTRF